MSPEQLKKLQALSHVFSEGLANPQQIQQLSSLLAQINSYDELGPADTNEEFSFIAAPNFG